MHTDPRNEAEALMTLADTDLTRWAAGIGEEPARDVWLHNAAGYAVSVVCSVAAVGGVVHAAARWFA